jgi:hypothetical protein
MATTDAVTAEDQYSYDKTTYNQLIRKFVNNEILAAEIAELKKEYPEATDLVREDWEEVLKNNAIFNKWKTEKFTLIKPPPPKNNNPAYTRDNMPAPCCMSFILICGILYEKAADSNANDAAATSSKKETKRMRIDLVYTGPIQELVKAFAACREYDCYNYASVFLPSCRNVHDKCFAESRRNTKKSFCIYKVRFYNGEKVKKTTPTYLESRNLKSFVGVVVVDLKGITRFGKAHNIIKLNGDCRKIVMTTQGVLFNNIITGEEDDDIFDEKDIPLFSNNKRGFDETREYETHVSHLLPDSIAAAAAQPLFEAAANYQFAKKHRYAIEEN